MITKIIAFVNKNKYIVIALVSIFVIGVTYASVNTFQNQDKIISNNTNVKKVNLLLDGKSIISKTASNNYKLDLKVSSLPSKIYSSASFSITFDKDKIECVNIKKGNVTTFSSTLPEWQYNIKASNEMGRVNIIYLDSTGGKKSFTSRSVIPGNKDTLLSMQFKLKNKADSGNILNFQIKDAIFATIKGDKDKTSLSVKNKNLKIKNHKIIVQ